MFPENNFSDKAIEQIKGFICGDINILNFVAYCKGTNEIYEYLDWIVDTIGKFDIPIKRRTVLMKNVNRNEPFEMSSYAEQFIKKYVQRFKYISDDWKNNPPKVSSYLQTLSPLTALGASKIYGIVADIYYQIDQELKRTEYYHNEYEFSLDVLPGYLAGGIDAENYISKHIMSKYPATMKKGERKRAVKEEIKIAFPRDCKGFPRWIQMPEWPIGTNEKPMSYMGQKSFKEYSEYYFRDTETNESFIVTQWW